MTDIDLLQVEAIFCLQNNKVQSTTHRQTGRQSTSGSKLEKVKKSGMSWEPSDSVGGHSRGRNGYQSLVRTQNLIIGGILRDLVRLIGK